MMLWQKVLRAQEKTNSCHTKQFTFRKTKHHWIQALPLPHRPKPHPLLLDSCSYFLLLSIVSPFLHSSWLPFTSSPLYLILCLWYQSALFLCLCSCDVRATPPPPPLLYKRAMSWSRHQSPTHLSRQHGPQGTSSLLVCTHCT